MGAPFDNKPGGNPPPNWGRVGVHSRAGDSLGTSTVGLGDPTRWGGTASLTITQSQVLAPSPQFVRAQAEDAYPRNWQMIGTLTVSVPVWESPIQDSQWAAILELTIGAGQVSFIHRINLRALLNLAISPALVGTNEEWYVPSSEGTDVCLPWVLPGGVIARALSARILVACNPSGESPEFSLPQTFVVTGIIAPYSAAGAL